MDGSGGGATATREHSKGMRMTNALAIQESDDSLSRNRQELIKCDAEKMSLKYQYIYALAYALA